jgi:hypothetical protein
MPRSSYDSRSRNLSGLPLVTEVEGVKIYVDDEDGSFWAKIGRDTVSRKSLADMKRLVAQRSRSVTVLVIGKAEHSHYEPDLTALEIVGVEKSRGDYGRDVFKYRRKDGGDLIDSFRVDAYPFDAATHETFKALLQEYREAKRAYDAFTDDWRKRWDAEAAKLQELTPEQIKELREQTSTADIEAEGSVPFSEVPDDAD